MASQQHRVAALTYRAMYILGAPVAGLAIWESRHTLGGGIWGGTFAVLFGISSLFILWLVYMDLETIDDLVDPDHPNHHDYIDWVNTGFERFLRVSILVFLLLRELANVVYPYFSYVEHWCVGTNPYQSECAAAVASFSRNLAPETYGRHEADGLFSLGSFLAFLCMAAWNGCALNKRFQRCKKQSPYGSSISKVARHAVVSSRIAVFALLSFLCAIYWLMILVNRGATADAAVFCAIVYGLCAAVVGVLRWKERPCRIHVARIILYIKRIGTDRSTKPPPAVTS